MERMGLTLSRVHMAQMEVLEHIFLAQELLQPIMQHLEVEMPQMRDRIIVRISSDPGY